MHQEEAFQTEGTARRPSKEATMPESKYPRDQKFGGGMGLVIGLCVF